MPEPFQQLEPGRGGQFVFRFERDGDATNFIVESDWEMPGQAPGFIKDLVAKGWGERNFRNALADMKALVEARVPAHA